MFDQIEIAAAAHGIQCEKSEADSIRAFLIPNINRGFFVDVGMFEGLWIMSALLNGVAYCRGFEPNQKMAISTIQDLMRIANDRGGISTSLLWSRKEKVLYDGWNIITPGRLDEGLVNVLNRQQIEVETTTLDLLAEEVMFGKGPVNFIKIDVEGAELEVLKGGESTIKSLRPKILVECHDNIYPRRKDDVIQLMESWDLAYRYTVVNQAGRLYGGREYYHVFFDL